MPGIESFWDPAMAIDVVNYCAHTLPLVLSVLLVTIQRRFPMFCYPWLILLLQRCSERLQLSQVLYTDKQHQIQFLCTIVFLTYSFPWLLSTTLNKLTKRWVKITECLLSVSDLENQTWASQSRELLQSGSWFCGRWSWVVSLIFCILIQKIKRHVIRTANWVTKKIKTWETVTNWNQRFKKGSQGCISEHFTIEQFKSVKHV